MASPNFTYNSTSELVKTRPRTKPGAHGKGLTTHKTQPKASDAAKAVPETQPKTKKIKNEPQTRPLKPIFQPMTLVHYNELSVIWPADKRIPSLESRRAWALARNLKPDTVHRWWWRRRKIAQNTGITIPDETYELAIGTPPTICLDVKDEDEEDTEQWTLRKTYNLRNSKISTNSRRSSSPCSEVTSMTSRDSIFPNSDRSSDTDVSTSKPSSILGKRAYTQFASSLSRSSSPAFHSSCSLPPSSPPLPVLELETEDFSSPGPGHQISLCELTLDSFSIEQEQVAEEPTQLECNQGLDDISDFTCSLCTPAHISLGTGRQLVMNLCSTHVSVSYVPSHIPFFIFIDVSDSFFSVDNHLNDVSQAFEIPFLHTLDSLWLMSELSAIPHLQSLSPDRPISLTLLPGVPAYHYLDLDDQRLGIGIGLGLEHGFCLGGNRYSYDGFFSGRCRGGCGSGCGEPDSNESKAEVELWNFEFEAQSLGESGTG